MGVSKVKKGPTLHGLTSQAPESLRNFHDFSHTAKLSLTSIGLSQDTGIPTLIHTDGALEQPQKCLFAHLPSVLNHPHVLFSNVILQRPNIQSSIFHLGMGDVWLGPRHARTFWHVLHNPIARSKIWEAFMKVISSRHGGFPKVTGAFLGATKNTIIVFWGGLYRVPFFTATTICVGAFLDKVCRRQ